MHENLGVSYSSEVRAPAHTRDVEMAPGGLRNPVHHVRYSIVVPVYNEEEIILNTYQRLRTVMDAVGESYELLFVNDGSQDRTGTLIHGLCSDDPNVRLVNFSRNFGHQQAISAGLDYASGDAVVVIDGDLQDPPELIPDMIAQWKQGYQVVYAKRLQRKGETLFKKWTAALFYRFLRRLTDVDIPVDAGDFRLMDRKVCDVLCMMQEKHRFVRGMVSWIGFRQTSVEYTRDSRQAGETKYSLKKMLKLSTDAVTSFSHLPIKLAGYVGGLLCLAGIAYFLVSLVVTKSASGIHTLIAISLTVDGLILLAIGILGEYVGRIYEEVKDRPLYLIDSRDGFADQVAHVES